MTALVGNQVKILHSLGSNLVDDTAYQKRATMFGRDIPRDNRPEEELIKEAVVIAKKSDVRFI